MAQAFYDDMNGKEYKSGESIDKALEAFNKLISINPDNVVTLGEIAYGYFLKAKSSAAGRAAALRAGLDAVKRCDKLDAKYAPCLWTQGLLLGLANDKQAAEPARRALATAQPEQIAEANFTLAAIIYERAEAAAVAELDEGLAAVARTLGMNPTWPRALAVQGGLAWRRAQKESDPARREPLLHRASTSLQRAFAGNPALKNKFAEVWRELEAAKGK